VKKQTKRRTHRLPPVRRVIVEGDGVDRVENVVERVLVAAVDGVVEGVEIRPMADAEHRGIGRVGPADPLELDLGVEISLEVDHELAVGPEEVVHDGDDAIERHLACGGVEEPVPRPLEAGLTERARGGVEDGVGDVVDEGERPRPAPAIGGRDHVVVAAGFAPRAAAVLLVLPVLASGGVRPAAGDQGEDVHVVDEGSAGDANGGVDDDARRQLLPLDLGCRDVGEGGAGEGGEVGGADDLEGSARGAHRSACRRGDGNGEGAVDEGVPRAAGFGEVGEGDAEDPRALVVAADACVRDENKTQNGSEKNEWKLTW
jgi:hypothetical protein